MAFYSNTPVRDFYLDLWEDPGFAFSLSDEKMEIPTAFHKRPDLMANKMYGSSKFWWIFALRNKDVLIDPYEDFTAGTEIFVPSKNAIANIGGV